MSETAIAFIDVLSADGHEDRISDIDLLHRLAQIRTATSLPFAENRMNLVANIGKQVLRSRGTISPFVNHFAFWIRQSALQKLANSFAARLPSGTHARARGLVFHLPPQNVETVFLYSWVLSYLAGNANLVRLPRELSPEMLSLCNLFVTALRDVNDDSQLFVHFPSQSDLGAEISAASDARVVWGGDAKIAAFAGLPLRNGGKSIWFGDRFSFCVLNGSEIGTLDTAGLNELAKRMFNDIFVFDQMACSSPHIVYVVGKRDRHGDAVEQLFDQLADVAHSRGETPVAGQAIRKMVSAFAAAARGNAAAVSWRRNELTRVIGTEPQRLEERVGGGYLRICYISALSELDQFVREHDQTVTHFGFTAQDIQATALAVGRSGISRWAPVGSALDFDFVWDGYDICFELTRLVRTF